MAQVRRWTSRLLHALARHAPSSCRAWAQAMLAELDYIQSDRAAILWALGSITALLRQTSRAVALRFSRPNEKEIPPVKNFGKTLAGLVSGMVAAFALALCGFGVFLLINGFFPSLQANGIPWLAWLTVIAIPEIVFVVFAIRFWRRRRSVAFGILLTAAVLATHFAMHIASHLSD